MNSELIITLPEDYEYCYHSTRNLELNRVQGVYAVHKYTENDFKSFT